MKIDTLKVVANAIAGEMLAEKIMLSIVLSKGLILPKDCELQQESSHPIVELKLIEK